MSRGRDPFSTALSSLRERLELGHYRAGAPIVIVEESRRLRLSVTPVREALAWLCGEGLIERSPLGGYLSPRLEPAVVRDRYALRLVCLAAGLEAMGGSRIGRSALGSSAQADLRERFAWVIRASGNLALADAYFRVQGQLLPLQAVEPVVFVDAAEEAERMGAIFQSGDDTAIRTAVEAYHRRRKAAAAIILAAAGDLGGSPPSETSP